MSSEQVIVSSTLAHVPPGQSQSPVRARADMDSASSEGELPITAATEGSYSSQQLVGLNHLRSKLLNRHHSINIVKVDLLRILFET